MTARFYAGLGVGVALALLGVLMQSAGVLMVLVAPFLGGVVAGRPGRGCAVGFLSLFVWGAAVGLVAGGVRDAATLVGRTVAVGQGVVGGLFLGIGAGIAYGLVFGTLGGLLGRLFLPRREREADRILRQARRAESAGRSDAAEALYTRLAADYAGAEAAAGINAQETEWRSQFSEAVKDVESDDPTTRAWARDLIQRLAASGEQPASRFMGEHPGLFTDAEGREHSDT